LPEPRSSSWEAPMLNLSKASEKPVLLIPVENQVRELDAKLLLACVAAGRGVSSVIGFKRDMEFRIASFPKSIFLSKSLRIGKRKFFPLARKLGHQIIAWDEEALVHLPSRPRPSPSASSLRSLRTSASLRAGPTDSTPRSATFRDGRRRPRTTCARRSGCGWPARKRSHH